MLIEVTWPSGARRVLGLVDYCLIPVAALDGTRVRFLRWGAR